MIQPQPFIQFKRAWPSNFLAAIILVLGITINTLCLGWYNHHDLIVGRSHRDISTEQMRQQIEDEAHIIESMLRSLGARPGN